MRPKNVELLCMAAIFYKGQLIDVDALQSLHATALKCVEENSIPIEIVASTGAVQIGQLQISFGDEIGATYQNALTGTLSVDPLDFQLRLSSDVVVSAFRTTYPLLKTVSETT